MGAEDKQYAFPAELDTYMQESIFSVLGFFASEEHLEQKLSEAEASYRDLALKMRDDHVWLLELERKLVQSKEEALLNAQALKRQVAEGQKLADQCRLVREECTRLERECGLYHKDRDMFMQVAYEAEDRAADADDRAAHAKKKSETLTEELERVREALTQLRSSRLETGDTEYVTSLKSQVTQLEAQNTRLRENMFESISKEKHEESDKATLKVLLMAAKQRCEETTRKLSTLQEQHAREIAVKQSEQAVHEMVVSAVNAGLHSAVEEEKVESLRARDTEFSSTFRCLESELMESRERAKIAKMNVQALLQEVQSLRQEAALCRGNLEKAEIEVQMLGDENKELRILLKRRYAGSESPVSPMQNRGHKGGRSHSGGRHRPRICRGHREEGICVVCNTRHPLMPLPANSTERPLM